jgi:hypothetical protein
MRAIYRAVLLTGLATFAPALTACSNFDADKLDVFGLNEKKKLPGERKDVFPGGVPGVTQGIPPEYMRGNQPPPDAAQSLAPEQSKATAATEQDSKAAAAEPEPEPKPKPKRPAKPRTASPAPAQQEQPATWPQQAQPPAQQSTQSPWPAPAQSNTASPWPSSPQPGTFSR